MRTLPCDSLRTAAELIEVIEEDARAGEVPTGDPDAAFEATMDCVSFMALIAAKHYAGGDVSHELSDL